MGHGNPRAVDIKRLVIVVVSLHHRVRDLHARFPLLLGTSLCLGELLPAVLLPPGRELKDVHSTLPFQVDFGHQSFDVLFRHLEVQLLAELGHLQLTEHLLTGRLVLLGNLLEKSLRFVLLGTLARIRLAELLVAILFPPLLELLLVNDSVSVPERPDSRSLNKLAVVGQNRQSKRDLWGVLRVHLLNQELHVRCSDPHPKLLAHDRELLSV